MKRDFLEEMGLEKDAIDRILDENSRDVGRWRQRAESAEADKTSVERQLADRDRDLEALKASAADAEGVRYRLAQLQEQYATETEQYRSQLADRDYGDAVARAVAEAGVRFSSKAAEKAFLADLMANRLELKDGALVGFEDYHRAQREADPEAFQSDRPAPAFVRPVGLGGPPPAASSRAREIAAKFAKEQYGVKESD